MGLWSPTRRCGHRRRSRARPGPQRRASLPTTARSIGPTHATRVEPRPQTCHTGRVR
jgi:hypothetical protein